MGRVARLDLNTAMRRFVRTRMVDHTIDQMVALCVERFGPERASSRAALARFMQYEAGANKRGPKAALDGPMGLFVMTQMPGNNIDQLRTLCMERFGADETPSRTVIGRFIRKECGARERGRSLLSSPEITGFVRGHMQGRTIDQVRALCIARFGAERAPSRAALGRFMRTERGAVPRGVPALRTDLEIAAFVRKNVECMTLDGLRAEVAARFPDRALPSRSTLGRTARKLRGPKPTGIPSRIAQHLELSIMVRVLAGKVPVDTIVVAAKASYPSAHVTRSAVHRFVQAELHAVFGTPAGVRRTKREASA